MRSLLLRRLSSLSLRQLGGARFVSDTAPCRIVRADRCGKDGEIGKLVISVVKDSPCGEDEVLEKKVPMSLMTETGTIGASHGWVATLKDGVVRLQDDLNPSASECDPKRITLPPLVTLPHCQTQVVTNVAMSSSSPEDEDCILAVKFLGPQLSLLRLAQRESEWVNIRIPDPGFFSSRVMYSSRDKMFSMAASGGSHTGYWDLEKHRDIPKLRTWYFANLPEFVQSEWGKLDSCCTSTELVESRRTGDMFMVKRFRERNNDKGGRMEEKQIMVFKLPDDTVSALYTEDIGDLCIFLSKSEPFCLQASSSRILSENSVYFLDNNESGIFSIKNKTKTSSFFPHVCPYHIPPQSYLDVIGSSGFASKSDSM